MRAWRMGVLSAAMALGAAPLAYADDSASEQAARLCLDHAQQQVRANGGDDVEIDRVIDLDVSDEGAVMQAEMSADYSGDQRTARVECEVVFEGDNRVVTFRQLDEAEGGALGGAFGAILGEDGDLDRDDSLTPDRSEQAAELCLDYAQEQVRDNGGDDIRMERLVDADVQGDRVLVEADMSAEYSDGERSARVECEVEFEGDNRVVAFRQSESEGGAFDGLPGDLLGNQ
jgi:hypothetical protein